MRAKTVIAIASHGRTQSRVYRVNHGRRIAPGMVATEQVAAQSVHHKFLRRAKHLRLGTAKAVNALLGVAHQKHAGRTARTHGAAIALKPRIQRLPLQRVGVLELVNH